MNPLESIIDRVHLLRSTAASNAGTESFDADWKQRSGSSYEALMKTADEAYRVLREQQDEKVIETGLLILKDHWKEGANKRYLNLLMEVVNRPHITFECAALALVLLGQVDGLENQKTAHEFLEKFTSDNTELQKISRRSLLWIIEPRSRKSRLARQLDLSVEELSSKYYIHTQPEANPSNPERIEYTLNDDEVINVFQLDRELGLLLLDKVGPLEPEVLERISRFGDCWVQHSVRARLFFSQQKFTECLAECEKAVDKGAKSVRLHLLKMLAGRKTGANNCINQVDELIALSRVNRSKPN